MKKKLVYDDKSLIPILPKFIKPYYSLIVKFFRRNFNDGGTCITYDAINAAYLDARKRISMIKS